MSLAKATALPSDVRAQLGANDQLFSVDLVTRESGLGKGSRVLIVRNPGGISADVWIDRGLDIGWADAHGHAIAWKSPSGIGAAERYNALGAGWCETFGGGLLATCGLSSTGAPSFDELRPLGLHGRVGHLPAENVQWQLVEHEEGTALGISGEIIESALGSATLRLERTLLFFTDQARLVIEDRVVNDSFFQAEHMFRHHLNFGYPLVSSDSRLEVPATTVSDRDSGMSSSGDLTLALAVAQERVPEQVLTCWPKNPSPGAHHDGQARVVDHHGAPKLTLKWGGNGFDRFIVWRDATPGVNVLGLEPATSLDGGQGQAREDGSIIVLAPGEARDYRTDLLFHM